MLEVTGNHTVVATWQTLTRYAVTVTGDGFTTNPTENF